MPLLTLETTESLEQNVQDELMLGLSKLISEVTGKSEDYVMVICKDGLRACMAGETSAAAFADIRGIGGLDPETNARLSKAICSEIEARTGTPASKIYLNFTDVPASSWGWDSRTFG